MKKTKIQPALEGKIKIPGIGTFNPAQLKAEGVKKQDLPNHGLDPAGVEKVWAAMQGKEIPEENTEQV